MSITPAYLRPPNTPERLREDNALEFLRGMALTHSNWEFHNKAIGANNISEAQTSWDLYLQERQTRRT